MFWNKIPNQKSFKNSNQKSKNMLNNFLPPQNKLKQPKTNKKKLNSSSPNKKPHENVTPPARFGSKNPWKNPPASPAALAAAKACRCWSAGIGRPKPPVFFWGTPQGIGWWFCRLKKTFKTSPFPGVSPSFFGALPRLFVFLKRACVGKKHASHFLKSAIYYMIWKQAFCKDHLKKIEGFKFKKTECRMNFPILREHIEYFISLFKSQHLKRQTHIFYNSCCHFFWIY